MNEAVQALDRQIDRHLARVSAWLSELVHDDRSYVPDLLAVTGRLKDGLGRSPDVVLREIVPPATAPARVLVAYIQGLVDAQLVEGVVQSLLATQAAPQTWGEGVLAAGQVRALTAWPDILWRLVRGDTVVFASGCPAVWACATAKYRERSVGQPKTEGTVRGPDEAFVESLETKLAQVRRSLPRPDLRVEPVPVAGERTAVVVAYLEGTTNPSLVDAVIDRLARLRVDHVPNATAIAGMIRDHPLSIFPTIRATERVAYALTLLTEGKVLVLVDGDPFVLAAPAPLVDFYRTAQDYSGAWWDSSFVRLVRLLGWALGVYLPALYIASTEVNLNVIPASLLTTVAGSRSGLPASPLAEVLVMILVVETLREAALRLPSVLGTTIGTMGAIVVGTAVVRAGFVSPQVIVLVTLTALSFYTAPVYELTGTWRLVGFAMLMAAAVWGMLGIILLTLLLVGELTRMTSFGTPYFQPWAPFRPVDWRSLLVRVPWRVLQRRPTSARPLNPVWPLPDRPAAVTPHLRTGRTPP